MSTASPLPLQPLPPSTVSEAESRALKQQVASRLAEHRQRRPRTAETQSALPMELPANPRKNRIASQVAERFAQSVSYHDFLQQEAEAAIRQAEAAAEVARRNAEAIAAAQQELLDELAEWNSRQRTPEVLDSRAVDLSAEPQHSGPADIIEFAPLANAHDTQAEDINVLGASELLTANAVAESATAADPAVLAEQAVVAEQTVVAEQPSAPPAIVEAFHADNAPAPAEAVTTPSPVAAQTSEPAAPPAPQTIAERFNLPTGPLEAAPLPANLIEFPRQLVAARKIRPRLAEGPLREEADATPERAQLRIFEVEASAVSTEPAVESVLPEWHTIRLGASTAAHITESPESQVSFAIPLYVAPTSQRLMAAAVDACCVAAVFLVAVAIAGYAGSDLPTGIPAAIAAAGTLFLFGLFYQLLFFSLNGDTPGMRYARISLCTFGDENPSRSAMRRRIGAILLASMPLGLGLLWACLDEEHLGWHDRISRMYPRAY